MPYDRKFPKTGRVELRFGKPLRFDRHYETPADRFVLRSVTDEIMYEIMLLSGQEYVDEYASRVKGQIAAPTGEKASHAPGSSAGAAEASTRPASSDRSAAERTVPAEPPTR